MEETNILSIVAIVLFVLAAFLIHNIFISPEELLVPGPALMWIAGALIPALSLVLVGIFLIKISAKSVTIRLSHLFLGIALVVVVLILSGADIVSSAFLISTLVGGILPLSTNDPCKSRTWQIVSAPKTIGFLLVLLILTIYASSIRYKLQNVLREKIVELATLNVGNTPIIDVNSIIPPGITPEEKAEIISSIKKSVPNWESLSEAERQRLVDEYLNQYAGIKEGIRRALEKSITNPDPETIRRAVEKQITEMPIFGAVFRNAHIIFAFIGAMLYSIILLFSEWVAFVVCVFIRFLLPATPKHD